MASMHLAAQDVSFAYPGNPPTLSHWSADFAPGTMTALTGPSGRGKSTLLYLIGTMLRPTAGDITIDGVSTVPMRDHERAKLRADQFGFVFQDAALDQTRSVLANVLETTLYRTDPIANPVRRATELLERFGVNVPPDRKPGQVSGGQAQRIALCRALLGNPSILLADEPTGNLDPASTNVVIHALREHAATGATVVIVTHSPEIALVCDKEVTL